MENIQISPACPQCSEFETLSSSLICLSSIAFSTMISLVNSMKILPGLLPSNSSPGLHPCSLDMLLQRKNMSWKLFPDISLYFSSCLHTFTTVSDLLLLLSLNAAARTCLVPIISIAGPNILLVMQYSGPLSENIFFGVQNWQPIHWIISTTFSVTFYFHRYFNFSHHI